MVGHLLPGQPAVEALLAALDQRRGVSDRPDACVAAGKGICEKALGAHKSCARAEAPVGAVRGVNRHQFELPICQESLDVTQAAQKLGPRVVGNEHKPLVAAGTFGQCRNRHRIQLGGSVSEPGGVVVRSEP